MKVKDIIALAEDCEIVLAEDGEICWDSRTSREDNPPDKYLLREVEAIYPYEERAVGILHIGLKLGRRHYVID